MLHLGARHAKEDLGHIPATSRPAGGLTRALAQWSRSAKYPRGGMQSRTLGTTSVMYANNKSFAPSFPSFSRFASDFLLVRSEYGALVFFPTRGFLSFQSEHSAIIFRPKRKFDLKCLYYHDWIICYLHIGFVDVFYTRWRPDRAGGGVLSG